MTGDVIAQNADADADIAFVLRTNLMDALSSQIENVNRILGAHEDET